VIEELGVEPSVVRHQRAAAERGDDLARHISERRRGQHLSGGDSMDVRRADVTTWIDQ
jgi:hypothetical protein